MGGGRGPEHGAGEEDPQAGNGELFPGMDSRKSTAPVPQGVGTSASRGITP